MKKQWRVLFSFFGFYLVKGVEKNEVAYRFDIFGRSISVAKNLKSSTCWNLCFPKGYKRPRQRMDLIFSVSRIFLRGPRIYVIAIYVGQVKILISKTSDSERGKSGIESDKSS